MLNQSYDTRRDLAIGETAEEAIHYAVKLWVEAANQAINARGQFSVALSGGSTPNVIYQILSQPPYANQINWSKVWLFWGDERSAPPDHPESNYHAAMQSGLSHLPLNPHQVFRMQAENLPEKDTAQEYETLLHKYLGPHLFDLVMLGMGEDGHTASLFPNTKALSVQDRLVVSNWVPQKKTWRMTITYPCIRKSRSVVFYVMGSSKQTILSNVLKAPASSPFPSSSIGEERKKALWIIDTAAAGFLKKM